MYAVVEIAGHQFKVEKDQKVFVNRLATEEGKKAGVMYGIIDHAINRYMNDYRIFDFGGSEIEGVSNFYKKFGAKDRSYYNYSIDNLPAWYKALKRIKG